ncbi:MAG: glycosyltransferase, partial [Bacteroidota bacterium]|nr:glycosyltransferase [Bacteroidota bacterium]
MQKTTFPFEIVIGEDNSTDGTREIVLEYQKQFPDKVRVVTEDRNVGAMNNVIRTLKACRGKYIAALEGDDYWTDPLKLQKQVDFLEQKSDYCICSGYADIHNEVTGSYVATAKESVVPKSLTVENLLVENTLSTLTVVFRNPRSYDALEQILQSSSIGDWPLYIYVGLLYNGKYFVMPEVFGVYRIHSGGVYSLLNRKETFRKLFHTLHLINCLTKEQYNYLLLLGTIIYRQQTNAGSNVKAVLISSIQRANLQAEAKAQLLAYVQAGERRSPENIFKLAATDAECLQVSGFLLAHAYSMSAGNLILFSRSLDQL